MPRPARILILAQTPPPTHGQSVMVGHLVQAARQQFPDRFCHVNLRLSTDEQDVGTLRPAKLLRLASCSLKALAACLFGGVRTIYYVPAPAKRGPIIRDVLLLSALKPFTKQLILHWHSVGLGQYLASPSLDFWQRRLRHLLRHHHLSLCLSQEAARDVAPLAPQSIAIVPNGIPDPCPDFPALCQARQARLRQRQTALATPETAPPGQVHLLYLGLCTRTKGIFEVLSTAARVAETLNQSPRGFAVTLTVAGPFRDEAEKQEFSTALQKTHEALSPGARQHFKVDLPGFTGPAEKRQLLASADLFLFPTRYENEGLPLTIIEALAFGLPIVSTRWRAIPEIFDAAYPFLAGRDALEELPDLALEALNYSAFSQLRARFEGHFSLPLHLQRLFDAILLTP